MPTIALYGSGEFLPWAAEPDRICLERAPASGAVLILPTAAAPEGDEAFNRWGQMGVDHFTGLGADARVVPLRSRDDAMDPAVVEHVSDARLIFFSGGNPGFLAETLVGTPFWDATAAAVARGVPIAGCSAGAVALGTIAPNIGPTGPTGWVDGVRLLPAAYIIPHFDALEDWGAGLRQGLLDQRPDGAVAVGIDEDTVLLGDGERWQVFGSGAAWVEDGTGLRSFSPGSEVVLPLTAVLN